MSERGGGRRVTYCDRGTRGLTHQQVVEKIKECRAHNEMIFLTIRVDYCRVDQFNETIAMRIAILENIDLIIGFAMYNLTRARNEYSMWFNWFLTFLSTDHQGKTKHLTYNCIGPGQSYISVEDGNKFATAIQLNNNDGHIESFSLDAIFIFNEIEAFETIWNMLLATGVPHVSLGLCFPPNETETNHNLTLPNLATNTTLKQLDLTDVFGSPLAGLMSTDFFDAMKVNKGIEKLIIHSGDGSLLQEQEMVARFEEMLRENSTLINIEAIIHYHNDVQQDMNRLITIETKFNRMWKKYIIHREATAATTTTTATASTTTTVEVDNNNNERERKKRLKMRMLLNLFMNKPVLRNTIIFYLVSGYPNDVVGNNENLIDSDDHDDGTDGDTDSDDHCNGDSRVNGSGSNSDDNTTCTL